MSVAKSILSVALAFAAVSAQASVTYTSESSGWGYSPLGVPDTTTYGEVFTVPADGNSRLDSFSFFLKGNLSSAYAGVASWNGTGAGDELFASNRFLAFFNNFTEVNIETGGLDLTPGQQYVVYFSAYGMENAGADFMAVGNGSAVQNGLAWDNANGAAPNHTAWNGEQGNGGEHFAGSMTFSAATSAADVPEPGSLALLGLGLAGLAGMRRRKSA